MKTVRSYTPVHSDGKASFVSEQEAAGYIAGYALANDISEHSYQLEGPCPLTTACF
jgi:2-keto-4-pentenoate hydratase/2-oxohepta-3-ene-1,7-dioic acid hydratase in catechol pathway